MTVRVTVDLRPQMASIRDQGHRETCLAHATSSAHEHIRNLSAHLSPEYLHFFSTNGLPGGCTMTQVTEALRDRGQPTEPDCPYLASDPATGWRPPTAQTIFRRETEPKQPNLHQLESIICSGRVPVLGITLPEPFFRPTSPWLIDPLGTVRGRHAVAGVGVGERAGSKTILVRNSWGVDWGDSGHAWLSHEFLVQHLKAVFVLTHEVI